jgi:hypothetical protein
MINLGLFQWFATVTLIAIFISNGMLFYALPLLELYPDYNCPVGVP